MPLPRHRFRQIEQADVGEDALPECSAVESPQLIETKRLEKLIGGRVELQTDVDPNLLGGIVVRIGDQLIDGSVLGRLERLRNQLASGAL